MLAEEKYLDLSVVMEVLWLASSTTYLEVVGSNVGFPCFKRRGYKNLCIHGYRELAKPVQFFSVISSSI